MNVFIQCGYADKRLSLKTILIAAALLYLMFCCVPTLCQAMNVERLAGADRYETAIRLSQIGWSKADTVILAVADDEHLVDAMTMAPLAKMLNAPILLTAGNQLNSGVAQELVRLGAGQVYVASGSGVILPSVTAQIKQMGIHVVSVGGEDRFATARNIANLITANHSVDTAIVTSAWSSADALSIAGIASANGWPILLTSANELTATTRDFLAENRVNSTYVIGGTGAVSDRVAHQLPGMVRLGGASRFETNTAILNYFWPQLDLSRGLFIVNGNNDHLVDALSAAPYLAKAPLLLTDGTAITTYRSLSATAFPDQSLQHNTLTLLGGNGATPQILAEVTAEASRVERQVYLSSAGATHLQLEGSMLTVNGLTGLSNWDFLYVEVLDNRDARDNDVVFYSKSDTLTGKTQVSFDLPELGDGDYTIRLYTGQYESTQSYHYYYACRMTSLRENGIWSFSASAALPNNISLKHQAVTNFKPYLQASSSVQSDAKEIKSLAAQITAGCRSDYEKVLAVHDWVSANIYYDYDAYYNRTPYYTTALQTLNNRYSVCAGYTNLTAALLRASDIPTRIVDGYAGSSEKWPADILKSSETNHAWNESYVDGRWLVLDTTWDSNNRREFGQVTGSGEPGYQYFDITLQLLSLDHIIKSYN
jgi:putative cell wall-binding protein/transglutaminase-like putative cysteine protease